MQLDRKNEITHAPMAFTRTTHHRTRMGARANPFSTSNQYLVTTMSEQSNTTTPPAIREYWPGQGGLYAGIVCDIKTGKRWHLILAEGQTNAAWGGYGSKTENCGDYTDGAANTKALLEDSNEHPAALWTSRISIDGHEDFYLPAQKELNLLYINLQDKCEQDIHWSSTQNGAFSAWYQCFEDGYQGFNGKDNEFSVRAVRRIQL